MVTDGSFRVAAEAVVLRIADETRTHPATLILSYAGTSPIQIDICGHGLQRVAPPLHQHAFKTLRPQRPPPVVFIIDLTDRCYRRFRSG